MKKRQCLKKNTEMMNKLTNYDRLTNNIGLKPDEADREAERLNVRLSADEVFKDK